jgi:hypothetical protein
LIFGRHEGAYAHNATTCWPNPTIHFGKRKIVKETELEHAHGYQPCARDTVYDKPSSICIFVSDKHERRLKFLPRIRSDRPRDNRLHLQRKCLMK